MSFLSNTAPFAPHAATSAPAPNVRGGQFIEDILPTWTDLDENRVRDLKSAVSCTARVAGVPKENLALDYTSLNSLLKRGSIAAQKIHPNVVSRLRYILHRLAGRDVERKQLSPLTNEWETLLKTVEGKHRRHTLTSFARYCSKAGISPEQVDPAALTAFETNLQTASLCKDPAERARRTLGTWNWARKHQSAWPSRELTRSGMREPYTFDLTTYPMSFQADVDMFLAGLANTDLDQIYPDGVDLMTAEDRRHGDARSSRQGSRHRAARPSTIKTRRFQIQQAAAALVRKGHDRSTITSLRSLVDPASNAKDIASFFWDRAGRKKNGQVAGIIELQRQIARFHCGLPLKDVQLIADREKKVAPDRQASMTPKNMRRLRALVDPTNRAVLLHLPAQLKKEAEEAQAGTPQAARLAMSAVALEMQLICPLRIGNLQNLRLKENLLRLGAGERHITHLFVYYEDVKNSQGIEWPLPPGTVKLIETYIARFRPAIAAPGNEFLFPGVGQAVRSVTSMRTTLCEPVQRWVGVEINAHLLRHYAAWSYLKSHPGHYETVRRILGHKDIETTIRYYTGLEAEFAAISFDATVLSDRKASRAQAAGVFGAKAAAKARRAGGAKK
jgi:integrase